MVRLFLFLSFIFSFQFLVFAQTHIENAEALLRHEMLERRIPGLQAAVALTGSFNERNPQKLFIIKETGQMIAC